MLERFRKAKLAEIDALQALAEAGELPAPLPGPRLSLSLSLTQNGPGAVIAEYKRASPSRGDINLDLAPADAACIYAEAGAAALSVLTEEEHFKGRLDYLEAMACAGLPMLRKDFLFHPLQVRATAATPASAYLLIARMFPTVAGLELCLGEGGPLGLEAVVEVFDDDDLALAREAGAGIIQVNNRDLQTLETDMDNARRMIARRHPGEVWICASGIDGPEAAREMADLGYDGLLVGTSLMAAQNPGKALKELIEGVRQ